MQEGKAPKIFISYSWSSDDLVVHLAERLVSDGVDVILYKWDLEEGHNKYAFMEQCVTDPSIIKVLIICDKIYADKANARVGGGGVMKQSLFLAKSMGDKTEKIYSDYCGG